LTFVNFPSQAFNAEDMESEIGKVGQAA